MATKSEKKNRFSVMLITIADRGNLEAHEAPVTIIVNGPLVCSAVKSPTLHSHLEMYKVHLRESDSDCFDLTSAEAQHILNFACRVLRVGLERTEPRCGC